MSWDTVSPGYRPLSWGYPGILRMPPVSHDANLRFQTQPWDQSPTAFTVAPEPLTLDGSAVYMRWETYGWHMGKITGIVTSVTP